jgi:hypothetical protein
MYEQEKWEVRAVVRARLGPATDTAGIDEFPTSARATMVVTQTRRRALRAHLQKQNDEPAAAPPRRSDGASTLHDLPVGSICAACRGACCVNGGDHGYITTATLRAAEARDAAGTIVDHYLAHVPRRTYAGSCIFHAPTGCALPRDLRSETCNRHLCAPLTRLAAGWVDAPERPYIATFTEPNGGRRIAIVRGLAARDVRPVATRRNPE